MPILPASERLRLREMTRADLDFMAGMLGDAEVMRFYPKVLDREGALDWIDRQQVRYQKDGHGWWLVEERSSGDTVGQVGLCERDWEEAGASGTVHDTEISYMIHRPFWRRGIAREGARACRDHAFQVLRLPRVISFVRPENIPSAATARSVGMLPIARTELAGFTHHVFAVSLAPT